MSKKIYVELLLKPPVLANVSSQITYGKHSCVFFIEVLFVLNLLYGRYIVDLEGLESPEN
jgi:hypothetical protein